MVVRDEVFLDDACKPYDYDNDRDIDSDDPAVRRIVNEIKELEHQGYQFEGAEGSVTTM